MLTQNEKGLWDKSLCQVAHQLTIVDSGEKIVIGALPLSEEELIQAAESTSRILKLLVDIYVNDFGEDAEKMALKLGFSVEAAKILSLFPEEISANVFARSDLILKDNRWQLIELNTATTVGGIFYASLPRLSGYQQSYDTLNLWAKYSTEYFDYSGNVAFIEDDSVLAHMKLSLHVMADELKKYIPCKDIEIIGHREVSFDGQFLYGPGGRIDTIYRLFNERDIKERFDEYQPILLAIQSGAVRCPMSPKFNILSNKGILALLWEKVRYGELSANDCEFITGFVPYTYWLTEHTRQEVLMHKDRLVIKPIDGNCGLNVYIGADESHHDWQNIVDSILQTYHSRAYVAQDFAVPSVMNVTLAHEDGSLSEELQKIIWGVFIFGEENLGGFIRAKNISGSNIINHANGASVGPIPFCQWMNAKVRRKLNISFNQ
ncbi:hypothetical protein [Klebsiella quasipneumoniae]|uniref:hypothetical protein n=1 Tax=Klebsiella quasipneumoniae TaxID=1463165 RepID=UPI0007A03729|nr:hypothetical protein [Klebsiella quasipneumoniae]KYZ74129.1 hypothetical protein A2G95_20100 [Klebsiella quasipneumoniae subsp. similipneumoniae]